MRSFSSSPIQEELFSDPSLDEMLALTVPSGTVELCGLKLFCYEF